MELGGNIELIGFNELDSSELIVLKKIIGNYARKFSDLLGESYEKLVIDLKRVHTSKFEIQAKLLVKGKPISSDVTDNNLFMCVAEAMKKLEAQALKI